MFLRRPSFVATVLVACSCVVMFSPAHAMDEKSIQGFKEAIIKLSPTVDPAEAEAVSVISHQTSRRLAKEYRTVGPAVFQNFLINIGARQRGYCAHYARDIGTRLKELRLKTLYLHWGAADAGTHLEHNVIIVTALNQDYRQGFIIDGWRNAGRLCWWPVLHDSGYVWKEDLQETAWLHDYELVQQKPKNSSNTAAQQKAATPPLKSANPQKAAARGKTPPAQKGGATTATLEISG